MNIIVKIFSIFFMLNIFIANSFCSNTANRAILEKANKLYEKHNYKAAISLYKKLCKKNFANGNLFYNIGTIYLKQHKIGYSLFWLEKAKFFIPLDRDLNKNLQIAKSRVKDELKDKTVYKYLNGAFFVSNIFSLKTNFYLCLLFFYILLLALVGKMFIYKVKTRRIIFRVLYIASVVFLYFLLTFSWQYYNYNILKKGYVVANKVSLKDDFNESANTVAEINDGTKIFVTEIKDNFVHVRLTDGTDGWINKKFVVFNF